MHEPRALCHERKRESRKKSEKKGDEEKAK